MVDPLASITLSMIIPEDALLSIKRLDTVEGNPLVTSSDITQPVVPAAAPAHRPPSPAKSQSVEPDWLKFSVSPVLQLAPATARSPNCNGPPTEGVFITPELLNPKA